MASPWYIYTHWVKNFVLFFLLQLKTVLPLTVKSKGPKIHCYLVSSVLFKFWNDFSFTYTQMIKR